MTKLFSLVILALIIGCSPFPPQPKANKNIYFLDDISNFEGEAQSGATIIIEDVETSAGLDTNFIAFKNNQQINYFRDAKWADSLDKVIRSTITESFENSRKFKSVINDRFGVVGNYAISFDIRDFQANFDTPSKPSVSVKIVTKLINLPKREILLNIVTDKTETASNAEVGSSVAALNKAFEASQKEIIEQISDFITAKE